MHVLQPRTTKGGTYLIVRTVGVLLVLWLAWIVFNVVLNALFGASVHTH